MEFRQSSESGPAYLRLWLLGAAILWALGGLAGAAQEGAALRLPDYGLKFGIFEAKFDSNSGYSIMGQGWPAFKGQWKLEGVVIELAAPDSKGPAGCAGPGRYKVAVEGTSVRFDLVSDDCVPRRMILGGSRWIPATEVKPVPQRKIVATATGRKLAGGGASGGSPNDWPSFRGPMASGVAPAGQNLPDQWDAGAGRNILWKTPIPGLAHSSPIVWGERIYLTTAISSNPKATFKPGLYGDGDASEDRTRHKWMIYSIDKRTGKVLWERVAFEGAPIDKRHIKSTYASSTPATDGRIVVAWFGSQGVYAWDLGGNLLWKVDLGRLDLGAYDIPTYEWGPASSPIIWKDLVILQCDTQADSFVIALDARTGRTVWKTDRDEFPSWGTPTVAEAPAGPELVTNAAKYIRGYDPATGRELWRIGRSSKITAPTPLYSDGLFVVASGRAPERPIFVIRSGARGDLTLKENETSNGGIVWSRAGRGPYMPTPLIYEGILYILANNGVFDAYDLKSGEEIYRERLPNVGSGFSASPVAADSKIYLSSEDGDILAIQAGRKFKLIGVNPMGESLMATPAISDGTMYVRSAAALTAVGNRKLQ